MIQKSIIKLLIAFLLIASPCFAIDIIGDYTEQTIPLLNENFRSMDWRIRQSHPEGFYPRVLKQDTEPAAGTGDTQVDSGEMLIWIDTNDSNKQYFIYNYSGTVTAHELP